MNSRTVLLRALRDHRDKIDYERIQSSSDRLNQIIEHVQNGLPLDRRRGYEGEAGKLYFNVFDHLIISQKDDFVFLVPIGSTEWSI